MKKVSFVHMADGTAEDYQLIASAMDHAHNPLADPGVVDDLVENRQNS